MSRTIGSLASASPESGSRPEAAGLPALNVGRALFRLAPNELRTLMQDLTMLLFTVVFFAVAFLYVKACQKLR